jgi:hypothetical protein
MNMNTDMKMHKIPEHVRIHVNLCEREHTHEKSINYLIMSYMNITKYIKMNKHEHHDLMNIMT